MAHARLAARRYHATRWLAEGMSAICRVRAGRPRDGRSEASTTVLRVSCASASEQKFTEQRAYFLSLLLFPPKQPNAEMGAIARIAHQELKLARSYQQNILQQQAIDLHDS